MPVVVRRADIVDTVVLLRLIQRMAGDRETSEHAGRLADLWDEQLDAKKVVLAHG